MVKFFPVDPGHLREELTRYCVCSAPSLLHSPMFSQLQCMCIKVLIFIEPNRSVSNANTKY